MKKLAPELWDKILGNLGRNDLKSLRLVEKHFIQRANPFLFDRVYVSPHVKDLQVLEAISKHPTIRLCVKEVVYSGVFYHEFENEAAVIFSEEAKNLSRKYGTRFKQQTRIINAEYDLNMTIDALKEMPNIVRVALTNHMYPPVRNFGGNSYSHYPGPRRERSGVGSPLYRGLPPSAKPPIGVPIYQQGHGSPSGWCDIGLAVMCYAIESSRLQIRELCVDYQRIEPVVIFGEMVPCGLSPLTFTLILDYQARAMFCNLQKLTIGLRRHFSEGDEKAIASGLFAQTLALAKELRELDFDVNNGLPMHSLNDYLGKHVWQKLHSVKISHVCFNKGIELMAFLKRHRQTLRTLNLSDCSLIMRKWETLVSHLVGWLELEHVEFRRLICANGGDDTDADCKSLEKQLISDAATLLMDERL